MQRLIIPPCPSSGFLKHSLNLPLSPALPRTGGVDCLRGPGLPLHLSDDISQE